MDVKTIQPDSKIKQFWAFINLFALIAYSSYIPLKISFNHSSDKKANSNFFFFISFDIIALIIFIFQILININTGLYSQGTLILNKIKIINHYIKNELFLDMITLLPIIINLTINIWWMDFLFIIRIIKIKQQFQRMEDEYLQFADKKIQGLFAMIKLLFYIVYFAHLCACLWHYVAYIENLSGINITWIQNHKFLIIFLLYKNFNEFFSN